MSRKTVSAIMLALLVISTLALMFNIQSVETKLSPLTVPEKSAAMQGTINLASQEPPPTEWNKTYGGTNWDCAQSVVQAVDGGYVMAGSTLSYGAGGYDFLLVKTDANGNMQWSKTYGGTNDEMAYSLIRTGDGGYAIAGWTKSYAIGSSDLWLVKTDANGNMQWSKPYGGAGYSDRAYCVVQTGDGGYAIAGQTYSHDVSGKGEAWLVKTDASGNMQWSEAYGMSGTIDVTAYSLIRTNDGGYALAGEAWNYVVGGSEFWLAKIDANGNMPWNKTCGGTASEYAYSVVQTSDGGYALTGETNSFGAGNYDFWLVKVSATSPPAGPQIIGIDPSKPIASGTKQLLSILGDGFVPDSEVTLSIGSSVYPIPPDRTLFVNPNRMEVAVGLRDNGAWVAKVTNPGSIQSNEYPFEVLPVSIEDGKTILELALQYTKPPYEWTVEDATKMAAIAGAESGWRANAAGDRGFSVFNCMGYASWGLWQIFMGESWEYGNKELLGTLGAPIDDPYKTAKWLLNPNNNVKAAYEIWKVFKRTAPYYDGCRAWTNYKNGQWKLEPWYGVFRVKASIYKCPVNVTITDNYGRSISESENQIPNASFVYLNATDIRVFYLPLDLTYQVQLNATDYGNCTIDQIAPGESTYETAFSQATLNLTSETMAEFDLQLYSANYSLRVDENGDGLIDYELIPEVEILTTEYDLGIAEIVPSKTIIGEGYNFPINITVMNYGAHTETFNVTLHANETFIESQTVTLAGGSFSTIACLWNTTGRACGNYTMKAYAWPVPNETYTADNILVSGNIIVTIPGDIKGDFTVDIYDAILLANAYNSVPTSSHWNSNADINSNNIVDIYDAIILANHYNQHYP